jgi:hypothetical protein
MGKGEQGDYSCNLHREFTSFAHLLAAALKLRQTRSYATTECITNLREKECKRDRKDEVGQRFQDSR